MLKYEDLTEEQKKQFSDMCMKVMKFSDVENLKLDLIPSPVSNETNAKELFLPIIGELSKFITRPICFPNNEYWY